MAEEVNEELPFIEPVVFTASIKERMATGLKARFENGLISIPDDTELLSDLHRIRKTYTKSGNIIFDAVANSKSHADRAWALMLANDCCFEDKQPNIVIL
jgi:phage FluMu gp28-like protein